MKDFKWFSWISGDEAIHKMASSVIHNQPQNTLAFKYQVQHCKIEIFGFSMMQL